MIVIYLIQESRISYYHVILNSTTSQDLMKGVEKQRLFFAGPKRFSVNFQTRIVVLLGACVEYKIRKNSKKIVNTGHEVAVKLVSLRHTTYDRRHRRPAVSSGVKSTRKSCNQQLMTLCTFLCAAFFGLATLSAGGLLRRFSFR